MATETVLAPIVKHNAKVSNIGTVQHLKNEKKTPFRLCDISFVTTEGELKKSSAVIWEKNADKIVSGGEYQVEERIYNGTRRYTVAPFTQGAGLLSADEKFTADNGKTAQMAAASITLSKANDYAL